MMTPVSQEMGPPVNPVRFSGQDKDLQTRHDLLISVPGIGTHTAAVILCELPGPEVLELAQEI